jgi:hypothetical protein
MKQFKQLFGVMLLVLTLGISAYAGQMDTPGDVSPPPPPSSASAPGDMSTPPAAALAPGDMEAPTLASMAFEKFLDLLALY